MRIVVDIDASDLDMDEVLSCATVQELKQELTSRGVNGILNAPDDSDKILETISGLLNIRPEDRRNKAKIVAAIVEL